MKPIPIDQQGHAWAGAAIVALLLPYAGAWALLGAVLAGAAKELRDRATGRGTPDVRDLWATVAGGVAALGAGLLLQALLPDLLKRLLS